MQVTDNQPSPSGAPETAESRAADQKDEGVDQQLLEGFWPSGKMLELFVTRWCDDVASRYELDDGQRERYLAAETKRWSNFAAEYRTEIQPLINEYIELRMELTPPDKKRVQVWAERATAVYEKGRGAINQATDEFRTLLNPLQRAKFEQDVLSLGLATEEVKDPSLPSLLLASSNPSRGILTPAKKDN